MDFSVRKMAEVENCMTSAERVMAYTKLDHEPGYQVKQLPPKHWPLEGNITFQDVRAFDVLSRGSSSTEEL